MAGTACTVVRRLSPAPLIRAITQQRVWPLDANIKVVETAASHHESLHSFCALTGGAVSTMREDIWGVAWRWCASTLGRRVLAWS